jgi:UDPglucose 6-dehydrogenase
MEESQRRIGNKVEYTEDMYGALVDADALMLVTEWPEFRIPNFEVVKKLLKTPVIFDGRNVYERAFVEEKGFDYFCIGKEKK